MTKETAPPVLEPVLSEPGEFQLTLDEYCARLSIADRRVELIGAFYATEKAAGRTKDMESAFAARYTTFINQLA